MGTHVAADACIAMAYFAISGLLWLFLKKRKDLQSNWIFGAFGLFILACALTHVMDIVTLWVPFYRLAAFFKVVTAVVSLATAVALYKLMPQILRISTPRQMQLTKDAEAAAVALAKRQLQMVVDGATNISIIATDVGEPLQSSIPALKICSAIRRKKSWAGRRRPSSIWNRR